MLDILEKVELALPDLLVGFQGALLWNSLLIDYHQPHVWRLWHQFDADTRILLHKIHPCDEDDALLHPHPWPSAVKVYLPEGTAYQTGFGWGDPCKDPPAMPAKIFLENVSIYEMEDPWAWHYVRPIGGPIYSLMVVGKPFGTKKQKRFGQERERKQLNKEQRQELMDVFRGLYG